MILQRKLKFYLKKKSPDKGWKPIIWLGKLFYTIEIISWNKELTPSWFLVLIREKHFKFFFFYGNYVNMMIKCLTQNLRRLWKTDNLQDRLLTFSSIQSHISGWIGHSYDIVLAWSWCSAAGTSIHSWAFWLHLWRSVSASWCPCLLFHHVWLCCPGTWIPPSLEDPLCSLWSAGGLGHSES